MPELLFEKYEASSKLEALGDGSGVSLERIKYPCPWKAYSQIRDKIYRYETFHNHPKQDIIMAPKALQRVCALRIQWVEITGGWNRPENFIIDGFI